jgi:hypothetical protein
MIGKWIYGEWLIPIVDYLRTIKKNEAIYEIIIPLLISIIVTIICYLLGFSIQALGKLRDLLGTTLSILIGFTITCLTVLVTSNNDAIDKLKVKKTNFRIISSELITMYRWILIMFSYLLISQVILLIFIFLSAFINKVFNNYLLASILLFISIYLILHILLLLIRNITNLYCTFSGKENKSVN